MNRGGSQHSISKLQQKIRRIAIQRRLRGPAVAARKPDQMLLSGGSWREKERNHEKQTHPQQAGQAIEFYALLHDTYTSGRERWRYLGVSSFRQSAVRDEVNRSIRPPASTCKTRSKYSKSRHPVPLRDSMFPTKVRTPIDHQRARARRRRPQGHQTSRGSSWVTIFTATPRTAAAIVVFSRLSR